MVRLPAVIGEAPDAVAALRAAALGWIDLAGNPVIQQLMLIDAPSVLGWERWRAMNERYALGGVRTMLRAVADEGCLAPEFVNAFSHMILAALDEIALALLDERDRVLLAWRHRIVADTWGWEILGGLISSGWSRTPRPSSAC